jgi:hypothetical protein
MNNSKEEDQIRKLSYGEMSDEKPKSMIQTNHLEYGTSK